MNMNVLKKMDERGSAGIKAVIAFLILGAFAYAGTQLVPLYWDHWNIQDEIETKVKFAFVNYDKEKVQQALTNEIDKLLNDVGAQYEKKNVRVKVNQSTKEITVEVWYSRTHNMPVYPPNPKQFYIKYEHKPVF